MKFEVSSESDSGDSINATESKTISDDEAISAKQVKVPVDQKKSDVSKKSAKQELGKSSTSSSSESNLTEERIK